MTELGAPVRKICRIEPIGLARSPLRARFTKGSRVDAANKGRELRNLRRRDVNMRDVTTPGQQTKGNAGGCTAFVVYMADRPLACHNPNGRIQVGTLLQVSAYLLVNRVMTKVASACKQNRLRFR